MKYKGTPLEVFLIFLKLGLTSFGGPIAHIGYYRKEIIEKRQWLSDEEFAQLLTLCQFLPGPASSQMGFTMGLLRAGWFGALAAFFAFTLPSAILLLLLSQALPFLSGTITVAVIHGLKLIALVVVAQAVIQMTSKLCPDLARKIIALVTVVILLMLSHPYLQLIAVFCGALAGLLLCRKVSLSAFTSFELHYGGRTATVLLIIFFSLLIFLPLLAHGQMNLIAVMDAFYRAGALVFGGGHVVLPLLNTTVVEPGWISANDYLAGYGAAQAVPGPVFAVAAYLGAILPDNMGGLTGAAVALVAIFLPGFLLVAGLLPLWKSILKYPLAASIVAGINASVVGLLAAALYDPIWVSVIHHYSDVLIASIGLILIQYFRVSALLICIWCIAATMVVQLI